ncbi:PREDICTED: probable serine/threonine-protein kinase PBL11 isoform X3 [Lupinus angustifolius]|uniref:probable serine/threonine-protein kinase PBL11 isoform X3 n=1 Tax=Lupinus angustifolius TaxID=3871 RepID=UPI00092E94A9|nr:PREDICTED: probable serine/threonine-protein kinase PBL11 isoform X3 [Lupinus angustifolius]
MGICWTCFSSSSSSSSSPHNPTSATTTTTTGALSAGTSSTYTYTSSTTTTTTTTTSSSGSGNNSSSINNKLSSVSSGNNNNNESYNPKGQILPTDTLRIFTFVELKAATRNFRPDTVLGEGGFGKVYKGWLDEKANSKNGTIIAVKKLNSESVQGIEEWQSEVTFLGRLSHPNLVKLLGYCLEETELLLVYEFMQKGSLENHLFGRGSSVQPLLWDIRLKIAIGAARGLAFLHTSEKVIYRDFKASNILLDGSYNAKISDFGLAKLGPSASQSHVTTRVMGTYGYAAPEYVATGHLYVKSDVYGFGVVLVEMLTAQRALDPTRPSAQLNLTDWVKPYLHDRRKLKSIMDSRLEGKYPSKAAFRIAQLALKCLAPEHKQRPSMNEVLESLERIEAANKDPKLQSNRTVATRHVHHRSPLHPNQEGR